MSQQEVIGVVIVFLLSLGAFYLNVRKTIKEETKEIYMQQELTKKELDTKLKEHYSLINGTMKEMTTNVNALTITVTRLSSQFEQQEKENSNISQRLTSHGKEIDELSKQMAVLHSSMARFDTRLSKLESK